MVLMEYGNRFYLLSFRPYALAIGALALFGMMPRSKTDIREYCFPNAFNISCGKDEVIVITSARYGRMNKGFCLTSDYHVGCWADVLYHVDRKCSGRHQCVISIPDTILHQIQPCPKDMLAYLESEYVCQRVQTRAPFPCKHLGDLVVTEKSGFLANIVTEEQGFGSNRCPWVISASKGRRINITLVDFAVATRYPEARNTCHVYASLRESDSASEVTVCGGRSRERSVFVSESSRVEITVMNFKFKNEPIYFLLRYEAIGCSDPKVPRGAFLQRDGVQATVRCNFTSQSWHIVCQGDTWFGSIDNCTVETQTAKSSIVFTETSDMYPIGLLIAVMVGLILGVLIGVFLLTLVLSCHKRYYANRRLRDAKELSQRVIYGTRRDPSSILDDGTSTYCTSASTGRGRFPEHEGYRYTHVCGVGTVASCQHQMSPG